MYLRRLKDLRIDNDLYQKQIADYLKISWQQYGLYEIGKRDIPIRKVIILMLLLINFMKLWKKRN